MKIDNNTDFLAGEVILFNKPLYWTSFDLVKKVKNLIRNAYGLKKIKVGHAGTLDPLADGLLIICSGKKTKEINLIQNLVKEYIATIKLGETTPSFDLETEIDANYPYDHISEEMVVDLLANNTGEQEQVPPLFSAKNIDGKRAYEYARKGIEKVLDPRLITIYELELIDYNLPYIKVRMRCSKGTYVRSFARDLGEWLNSGAHLTALTRTYIGDYSLEDAFNIEDFEKRLNNMKQS